MSPAPCCFICLGSPGSGLKGPLSKHCSCPSRFAHSICLARWRLQQAGRPEETTCRFCSSLFEFNYSQTLMERLPSVKPRTPVMSVHYGDVSHNIKVYPGAEGKAKFQDDVRRLLGLRDDQSFQVNFECQPPGEDGRLELPGIDSFDAACFCASVTAGEREAERQRQLEQDALDATCPFSPHVIRRTNEGQPRAQSTTPSYHNLPLLSSAAAGSSPRRYQAPELVGESAGGGAVSSSPLLVSPSSAAADGLATQIALRSRSARSRTRMGSDRDFLQFSLLLAPRAGGILDGSMLMDLDDE